MNAPIANPHPPRQHEPVFFLPGSVLLMIVLCSVLYAAQSYFLDAQMAELLLIEGAFIPARYGADGPPFGLAFLTSPFTYSLLHASFAHLAINMIWLAAFGAPLAERIGAPRFVAFWFAAALGAAALHYAIYSDSAAPLVGASGSIAGMMGAASRFAFRTVAASGARAFAGAPLSLADSVTNRTVMSFVSIWMAINLVSGLGFAMPSNAIAWEAHIGGFLVGFLGLRLFDR